jgi:uncharacterized protein YaiL (DUF2058 family)
MSGSLRDQLMGLGFKPAPKPEPKAEARKPHPPGHPARRNDARGKPPQAGKAGANAARPRGEIDLGKAYAIRAQKEKDERIAAEKARQEEAQRKREGKLKLAELLKGATLNDAAAEIARHFEYGGKIRRVYVNESQLAEVNDGRLGVIQLRGRYLLVARDLAESIRNVYVNAVALLIDPSDITDAGDEFSPSAA